MKYMNSKNLNSRNAYKCYSIGIHSIFVLIIEECFNVRIK